MRRQRAIAADPAADSSPCAAAFRVRDRGLDVVAHQPLIEHIVVAGGVGEHARVERSALVPEPRHGSVAAALSCSAGAQGRESATTSVPVPSLVKISASRLSVDLY
jgi:hypothetical protein